MSDWAVTVKDNTSNRGNVKFTLYVGPHPIVSSKHHGYVENRRQDIQNALDAARAQEREECAKVAESRLVKEGVLGQATIHNAACERIAGLIRSRA